MNTEPISKELLIHDIKLFKAKEDSTWGSKEDGNIYDPFVAIYYTRVDHVGNLSKIKTRYDTDTKSVVFIDKTNSSPFIIPKIKDLIEYDVGAGIEKRTVVQVNVLSDDVGIHHLEIELN